MAVIINELEVITEQPPLTADPQSGQNAALAQAQAARQQITPDIILGVWLREEQRCARTFAG
jgi:hypothetical protein